MNCVPQHGCVAALHPHVMLSGDGAFGGWLESMRSSGWAPHDGPQCSLMQSSSGARSPPSPRSAAGCCFSVYTQPQTLPGSSSPEPLPPLHPPLMSHMQPCCVWKVVQASESGDHRSLSAGAEHCGEGLVPQGRLAGKHTAGGQNRGSRSQLPHAATDPPHLPL